MSTLRIGHAERETGDAKESRSDARRRRREEKAEAKRRAEEERRLAKEAEEQRKRDEIEGFLAADPQALKRIDGALTLYERLHDEIAKVDRVRKKDKKERAKAFDDRLRDAEIFEHTSGIVDDLYEKLQK